MGVRDLIALCERFSLIDVMFEGERPFLVLDDPFTNLDDDTIAHAKELLLDGLSATEACYGAGFNCYTYFITKFKEETGITPAKFR